jgi:hypothetical protein
VIVNVAAAPLGYLVLVVAREASGFRRVGSVR